MLDMNSLLLWGAVGDLAIPQFWITIGLVLAATVIPYMLGVGLARGLRVPEYAGKVGFIFLAIGLGTLIVVYGTPKFGIDLRGGVILVYEIDEESTKQSNQTDDGTTAAIDNSALVAALNKRLNPKGVNEIQIRQYGDRQVEVIVPDVEDEEIEAVKRQIEKAGQLEFLIVATDPQRDDAINIALNDPTLKRERFIRDAEGKLVGRWVRVAWESDPKATAVKRIAVQYPNAYYRDAATGDLLPEASTAIRQGRLEDFLAERGIQHIDCLMKVYPNPAAGETGADPDYRVTGNELARAFSGSSNIGDPIVEFQMNGLGATRMGNLTSDNISEEGNSGRKRYLGIVLDEILRSAPSINSRIDGNGQITGNYSRAEVNEVVQLLQSGKLPAVLQKVPVSENQISPLLGQDTINKGRLAIGVSLISVLVFMIIYYRFAGVVACVALIMNTLLVVAFMIMIKAAFTLPGLAGMVLTVGMAVDANVLIYERIREELARGSALRMAIRNGFSRAMSTIIDSNLTTIITAVVLYVIGTEQLKGFAVTLILGIAMSMFTAIFVARVIFDIAEKRRFITQLNMMDWWGKSNINFIRMYVPATIVSVVLIAIGLGATVVRGKTMFDIDFNGGTSVEMLLADSMPESEVRGRISKYFDEKKLDYTVTRMDVEGRKENTLYKVDTSIPEVEELEQTLEDLFKGANGESLLASNKVQVDSIAKAPPRDTAPAGGISSDTKKAEETTEPKSTEEKPIEIETPAKKTEEPPAATPEDKKEEAPPADVKKEETPAAEEKKEEAPAADPEKKAEDAEEKQAEPAATPDDSQVFRLDVPADLLAQADDAEKKAEAPAVEAPAPADETKKSEEAASDDKKPAETPAVETPADDKKATTPDTTGEGDTPATAAPVASALPTERTSVTMSFDYPVNPTTLYMVLNEEVRKLADAGKLDRKNWDTETAKPVWLEELKPDPTKADWTDSTKNEGWSFVIAANESDTRQIIDATKSHLEDATIWNASSKIGSKVAGKTRYQALNAVFASLIGIIGYVWFRFHRLAYGVAAVVALLHDVLVTIGLIALSAWLAPFLGFLQVEEFKISLTVIAAILTLIGYSLNDTIVTFDRIREVKGKSPELTAEMINRSVNETLSRTFLTAGTTLIVVFILYFMGGSGIHGFAFSMLIGVIAGTYSSVFIAAPLLMWMAASPAKVPAKEKSKVSV